VDFLFVLIELFSLGVMAEALQANIDCKSAFLLYQGQPVPKFQVEGVTSHEPFFLSDNEDEWPFMWCRIGQR